MVDPDRRKRLKIRAWRRGTKEMDFILGSYVDAGLARFSDAETTELETLMEENDQEIYAWISGHATAPARFANLIGRLKAVGLASQG